MAPLVRILLMVFFPISYPISKVKLMGIDHSLYLFQVLIREMKIKV